MSVSFLDVANLFLSASGFLMLYTAYRDREVLKEYNMTGTLLIIIAVSFFLIYYFQEGFWLSLFLTLPNYGYWLIVGVSLLRNRG